MSLMLYFISFILFLSLSIFSSSVIWGVWRAGTPTVYMGIGALVIFGIGVALFKNMPFGKNAPHAKE